MASEGGYRAGGERPGALPTRVAMGPGEPAYALFTRLARRHGAPSVRLFARGNGMDWASIVAGRETARVATLAGVDAAMLEASTFVIDGGTARLAGEALARTEWSLSPGRLCPRCNAEDEASLDHPPPRAYRRSWWDVLAIRRCPRHGTDLVPLEPSHGFVASAHAGVASGAEAFAGENYVLGRLGFAIRRRVELLDELPLARAVALLERCGAVRLRGRWARSDVGGADACLLLSAGMAAFDGGPPAFDRFLDGLVSGARPCRLEMGPRLAYGRLYAWLAHDERDPAYEGVRRAIRAHALATLPLRPGQPVLGQPVGTRRLGSVAQMSRATNLRGRSIDRLLTHLGASPETGPCPVPLFPAGTYDRVVELANATCWSSEVRERLGQTHEGMASLSRAGCLEPSVPRRDPGDREDGFPREDVERLLRVVSRAPGTMDSVPMGCAILADAARRGMSSVGAIMLAVLEGRLAPRGVVRGRPGLSGLVFAVEDVLALGRRPTEDVPWTEIVAAVGGNGIARALVAQGHLGVNRRPCGFRNRRRREVVRDDWRRFRATFVSAGELAAAAGSSARGVTRRLSEAGVKPAMSAAACGGRAFYRRDMVVRSGGIGPGPFTRIK